MTGFLSEPWPSPVVILSTRPDVVAGLDPRFCPKHEGPHRIEWHEGGHVRSFSIARKLAQTRARYSFEDADGERHTLIPMTLALYERHVRPHTVGKPMFQTLEELERSMRREW